MRREFGRGSAEAGCIEVCAAQRTASSRSEEGGCTDLCAPPEDEEATGPKGAGAELTGGLHGPMRSAPRTLQGPGARSYARERGGRLAIPCIELCEADRW